MKKLCIVILLISLLFPVFSFADLPDITTLETDELLTLMQNIKSEILSRSQWEEVTVEPGHYVIGEDIPEGHWTIKYFPGEISLVEYFKEADETGINPKDILVNYNSYGIGDPTKYDRALFGYEEIDLLLIPGYHLNVSLDSVIFTPFIGRKSPFFN